jgi:hypothetical protein
LYYLGTGIVENMRSVLFLSVGLLAFLNPDPDLDPCLRFPDIIDRPDSYFLPVCRRSSLLTGERVGEPNHTTAGKAWYRYFLFHAYWPLACNVSGPKYGVYPHSTGWTETTVLRAVLQFLLRNTIPYGIVVFMVLLTNSHLFLPGPTRYWSPVTR